MARGTFGERLKRERDLREVPLEEIAKATRIPTRYLEALENEEWGKLPGGIFGRGFVRNIAHYVGLNETDLLAEYDLARREEAPPLPPPAVESGIPRPPVWPFAAAALLVFLILVIGGVFGWHRYSAHRARQKPAPEAPAVQANIAPATVPLQTVPPAPSPVGEPPSRSSTSFTSRTPSLLDLSISARAATRVRVIGDKYLLMDRHLRAGETRHLTAKDHFEVTADDSSAVLLELNGRAIPAIGAPGASATMVLSRKDLRQAPGGNSQP